MISKCRGSLVGMHRVSNGGGVLHMRAKMNSPENKIVPSLSPEYHWVCVRARVSQATLALRCIAASTLEGILGRERRVRLSAQHRGLACSYQSSDDTAGRKGWLHRAVKDDQQMASAALRDG